MDATIIDRLEKLLALKARPGSVHEAEAAARAIQRLLSVHQLSELELEGLLAQNRKSDFVKSEYDTGAHSTWRHLLLNGVATQNFCRVVARLEKAPAHVKNHRGTRRGHSYHIIGKAENITVVIRLYEYLAETIERLGSEYVTEQTAIHKPYYDLFGKRWNPKGIGNDFRRGAMVGVVTKLYQERTKVVEETGTSALVVVKDAELDKAVSEQIGKTVKAKSLKVRDDSTHYTKGIEAGLSIGLEPQLTQEGASGSLMAGSERR